MQGRRGENDVTGLGRPNISFPEHISNFTHNTSTGSSCAFWVVDLLLVPNYDL